MRTTHLVVVALAAVVIAGCAPKPVKYDFARPAQALLPVETIGVEDGRPRFRRIFSEQLTVHGGVENPGTEMFLHRLSDEPPMPDAEDLPRLPVERLHVKFVPGYLGDMAPGGMQPYQPTIERLVAEEGYRIDYVEVTGAGSSEQNAGLIDEALRAVDLADGDRLLVIGYSKGTTDVLHFLADYPETAARVDAFLSISGVVIGTPLADLYPTVLPNFIATVGGAETGDYGGLDSIKRSRQMPWLAAHPPPADIRYFSIGSFARKTNISKMLHAGWDDLAQLDPMNDSQVIFHDQVLPDSTLLGWCNADHWAVALPFTELAPGMTGLVNHNAFPRDALLEAMLLYVREALAE